jgi:hypothetical protein
MMRYNVIMGVYLSAFPVLSAEIEIVQILLIIRLRNTCLLLFMWDRPLYYNVDLRLPTLEQDLPLRHTSRKECKISVLMIILMTVENLTQTASSGNSECNYALEKI